VTANSVVDDSLLPSFWYLAGIVALGSLATLIAFNASWTGTMPVLDMHFSTWTYQLPFGIELPLPEATLEQLQLAVPLAVDVNIYALWLYFWPLWVFGLGYNKQNPYRPDRKTAG
jgi:hypothetical protein